MAELLTSTVGIPVMSATISLIALILFSAIYAGILFLYRKIRDRYVFKFKVKDKSIYKFNNVDPRKLNIFKKRRPADAILDELKPTDPALKNMKISKRKYEESLGGRRKLFMD